MASIRLTHAPIAHITDLGRHGYERFGIAVNGAADQLSAQLANALVGNPRHHPVIEVVAGGISFVTTDHLMFAVTGALADVQVDGCAVPRNQPVCAEPGAVVHVARPRAGLRSYVAVRGEIQAPRLLGSCAPDLMIGLSTALVPGTTLEIRTTYRPFRHPHFSLPLFRFDIADRYLGHTAIVDVVEGPQAHEYPGGSQLTASRAYQVTSDSNHVGLRLQGPTPARDRDHELVSRGVPLGAVEVPPEGGLLVLLRGRLVTAGYPVIAVASRTAQDVLGQVRPGQTVRFRYLSVASARRSYQEQCRALDDLRRRARSAFQAAGVPS